MKTPGAWFLSTSSQKSTNVPANRLLTRAALIGAVGFARVDELVSDSGTRAP